MRHFANPVENFSVPQSTHVVCSPSSVSTNQIYAVPDQGQLLQSRHTETTMPSCPNNESCSPTKLSPIKTGNVVIKQEHETSYDLKRTAHFNENENIQVKIIS